MTRMLASVSTLAEAEIALAGGADIIDMGPAPDTSAVAFQNVLRDVVTAIAGRCLVSATSSGPAPDVERMVANLRQIAATGVDQVGVVLPSEGGACIEALAGLTPRARLLAVLPTDAPPDPSLLPLLADSGFAGAMIDTGPRRPGGLLDRLDLSLLHGFVGGCRRAGLMAGLLGSLETPDIPRLLVLAPDLLGFREALRDPAGQGGRIDPARVREIRGLIPPESRAPGASEVDDRPVAGRAQPLPSEENGLIDLVFVEDLVLPVFIGAYARERDTPQKVGFAVTASVISSGRAAEDMRDVFSYDVITDGIRMLAGSGHFVLIEVLAERIAAMVLSHARVTKVVVRVRKLETGSGTVGVQIERRRLV